MPRRLDAAKAMMLINRICAIVLLASLAMGIARSQTFTPARFGNHELSVINTLRVPIDRPPGGYDVSLTCQVIVEADGSTAKPHCLVDERYRAFHWQVIRAVSGAVMEPATVDGEPVRVVMNFMAGFRCLEACAITVLSNHARYVHELGFGYSSPQPILEAGTW